MGVRGNMNCIEVSKKDYLKVARHLKEKGFQRLLTVSAVDWIEEGTYEVYFMAHNLNENAYVKVKTSIRRDAPQIPSLSEIWPNAAMHEREAWELLGVNFEGMATLEPLFLEDWVGPPPFKKDCHWREYVKENFDLSQAEEGDENDAEGFY
ncbi:MAG: NADH-quinone oxidoreductase subunit C [Anaerolineae bacterium]